MKRSRSIRAGSQATNATTTTTTTVKRARPPYISRGIRSKDTVRAGKGFPKKIVMTHTYFDGILLQTGATGGLITQQFTCNGMYDPDVTGSGHQPLYYDQMTALYNHYTVVGSKITLRVCSSSSTAIPCTFGVYINDDSTVTPTYLGITEQSLSTHTVVPPGGNETKVVSQPWSAKKTFGGAVLANDDLQGTVTTNPTELQIYTVFAHCPNMVAQATLYVDVTIEYIAVWDELKDVAAS